MTYFLSENLTWTPHACTCDHGLSAVGGALPMNAIDFKRTVQQAAAAIWV